MIEFRNTPDFGHPYFLSHRKSSGFHYVSLSIVAPNSTFDLTQPDESYFENRPNEKSKWPSRKFNKHYCLTDDEFNEKFMEL